MSCLPANRPLVAVAAAYTAGLLLAQLFHPPLVALSGISGFVLVLVLVLVFVPGLKTHRTFLIWPLLALAGWANFAARTAVLSPVDLRVLLGSEPAIVTVRGTLAETPRLKVLQREDQEKWRSVAQVYVREIRRDHDRDFEPAAGEVLVTTPDVLGPDFFSGQPVEISGVMARPPPPLAEGLFDFQNYLATRGIYYQVRTESTNDWKLLAPRQAKPPLTDRFLNWSQPTLALGLPVEDEPLRLLWAMTLGWKTAFTGDIAEPFLRAGTMHMFAVDGLRIALVSGLIVTLLRVLRLSRAWCGAVAIPAIWFYTAATGWEASAIRASVMMTIVLGGWALKRPGDLLNSLAAAALIILLADPRQLLEASFQLSFFVMLVIALLLPPLNAFSDRMIAAWLRRIRCCRRNWSPFGEKNCLSGRNPWRASAGCRSPRGWGRCRWPRNTFICSVRSPRQPMCLPCRWAGWRSRRISARSFAATGCRGAPTFSITPPGFSWSP